jgi:hypothetical protein
MRHNHIRDNACAPLRGFRCLGNGLTRPGSDDYGALIERIFLASNDR